MISQAEAQPIAVKKSTSSALVVLIAPLEHIEKCLEAAEINKEQALGLSTQVGWMTNESNEPYAVYAGSDERTLQLLVSSTHIIATYEAPERVATIIGDRFWIAQGQIHQLGSGQYIEWLCCNSRYKQQKKENRIEYAPLEAFAIHLKRIPRRYQPNLTLKESSVLFNMYARNESLPSENLLMDVCTFIDMKNIKFQKESYSELFRRICNGDLIGIEEDIAAAGFPESRKSQLRNQLKKITNFNDLMELRRSRESQDRKYQNIRNLQFTDLQVGYLEVANSATMDVWVSEMQANVKQAYNNISGSRDFKTRNSLALLKEQYSTKLQQLSRQARPNSRAERHISVLQHQLNWFYGYHDRYLRQEFLSTGGYFLNELLYRARQKSNLIQKLLIIMLVLLLIELLSENSFVTVTLTLVAGIFYLRL